MTDDNGTTVESWQGDPIPTGATLQFPAPEGAPKCRACGCWDMAACWDEEKGPCYWAEPDLCSRCAEILARKCATNGAMSIGRSRSGGNWRTSTCSR